MRDAQPHGGDRVKGEKDSSALAHISKRVQRLHLAPMISLPDSGIERISLWVILTVALWGEC